MAKRTLLVAGASGLVGYAALRHFKARPGWDVVGLSRRRPAGLDDVEIHSVDLTDPVATAVAMSRLPQITHVIYAALFEKPGLIAGWRETDQMQTNLAMLRNLLEPLERAAPGLTHVTLLQGTKAYGSHIAVHGTHTITSTGCRRIS
jgi:nucleoside-diphosphate-sugar epimerase